MATWEDGPEYAPLERPAEFSSPTADPLEIIPPAVQSAALAPIARPAFDAPQAPVAPLAQLVPVVADERNPELPFDVASSTVTSMDSAWGAAHWSPPGGAPGQAPITPPNPASSGLDPTSTSAWPVPPGGKPGPYGSAPAGWPAPTTAWPSPSAPFPPVAGPAQSPSGYPPPGTPQWFGPGPTGQLPPTGGPTNVNARAVSAAATPGLLICLAVGGFIQPFAPITLALAFFLSSRVKVAQTAVRRAFFIVLGFLGLIAVVGLLGWIGFAEWWSYLAWWSLLLSWAMLITVIVLVYRGLKNGPPRPPVSYTSNWG